MTYTAFVIIEILLMCFLSFLMGWMLGANKGAKETTEIWKKAYEEK